MTRDISQRELEEGRGAASWLERLSSEPDPEEASLNPRASGRVLLRMPPGLHAELKRVAREYRISMNELVVYFIAWGIGKTNVPPDRKLRMHRMFRDLNIGPDTRRLKLG